MNTALAPRLSESFSLAGRVAIITGGAGLLGQEHAAAILEAGGTAILADVDFEKAREAARGLDAKGGRAVPLELDVTSRESCKAGLERALAGLGRVDVLVNNAARNPKVEDGLRSSRFESQSLEEWEADLAVGLRGAFLTSQVFGSHMARNGGGTIVNVASDLGLIAPDQRIYREEGESRHESKTKPISYSVVKGGLILMTRYLATYWAEDGVRVNALCPGGVENGQSARFVERLSHLIPLGRMARKDEYRAALVFLAADASSYMTGSTLVLDGGRTTW
jgi:NAD(P)-dependent dehydrogenase (short-subunit alcohol dehydrogenase family)